MKIIWGIRDWIDCIAALRVDGPLPARTVIVPHEAMAHALRRELVASDRADLLAGTRFLTLLRAAAEVLHTHGVAFAAGEESLRAPRLRILFRRLLPLQYFAPDLLRGTVGWDEAFARTIGELEDAGLAPEDLDGAVDAQVADVGVVWRHLTEMAGDSWARGRIIAEAASLLEGQRSRWPLDGPVLVPASGDMTAAAAGFVRAIPDAMLAIVAARPLRTHYLDRLRALFGEEVADMMVRGHPVDAAGSEREILASFFFAPPDVLANPARPRSNGPDGTVHLEAHAGLEAELEATADWVAREIIERRTPLEEIAVLVPEADPLAVFVAERLRRLPSGPYGELSVHVAGGLPATGSSAGARVLAVIRALRAGLAADALADMLPALRTADLDRSHLSRGAAMDLAYSLGTIGGSAANPEGALEWSVRVAAREARMAALLARVAAAGDEAEQLGLARSARDVERLLADLRAVRPALDALVGVARHVAAGAPLASLWAALRDFLREWLLEPGGGVPVWRLLDEALASACGDAGCGELGAAEALEMIEATLAAVRLHGARFGDPAVYIGTVRDAAGLPFRAVRIIGLAEGSLPSSPREDPVLSDRLRGTLAPGLLPTAEQRALAGLHALDRVVRAATGTIVLSAPRLSAERTDREPAAIFIEAAAALGRPNSETRERKKLIPNGLALERDAFGPARRALRAFRAETPISLAAWLDRTAARRDELPGSWNGRSELDLARIATLQAADGWNGLDGLIGAVPWERGLPGLTPERPISASALRTLLECPHRFLFERVLYWEAPPTAPPLRALDALAFGGLFHRVAESFFRAHGGELAARTTPLAELQRLAAALADRHFDELCEEYPLVGASVQRQQRRRLQRSVAAFLEYDWQRSGGHRFVAVEKSFGAAAGVELSLPAGAMYLRGFIDRIDVSGDRTVIRDLKTGHPHPRIGAEQEPDPLLDIQLALYGIVARQLAGEWGIPDKVSAAYAYAEGTGESERSYDGDFDTLEAAARGWLGAARQLLGAGAFPRTPSADDCRYCAFDVICAGEGRRRSETLLASATGAIAAFRDARITEA